MKTIICCFLIIIGYLITEIYHDISTKDERWQITKHCVESCYPNEVADARVLGCTCDMTKEYRK